MNRVDLSGQWPSFADVCNFVGSVADDAVNLRGDVTQAIVDTAVDVARIGWRALQAALDVGQKMLDDLKEASDAVFNAAVSGLVAVAEAWDNLDPGLKQWIITGAAFAVSFIPIAGPLISCIIDGTFVDMFSAIMAGNWAMVGMCALAFVPGVGGVGKLAKVGKLLGHTDDVSRAVKAAGKSGRIAVIGEDMKGRVLPFARKLESKGLKVETFTPSKGLTLNQALDENAQWVRNLRKEGTAIADIGPSPARPLYPEPSSPFYKVECEEARGYWNLWKLWGS